MPSVLVTPMTGSEDLLDRILGRRARALHSLDHLSDVFAPLVLHGAEQSDRLAVAGDDHGFAALDRPDQAGQVGLGLVCCHPWSS